MTTTASPLMHLDAIMFAYCQGVDTSVVEGWEPLYEVHVHNKITKLFHTCKKSSHAQQIVFLKKKVRWERCNFCHSTT